MDSHQIVMGLLIIPQEQIFRDLLFVRNMECIGFLHIKYSRMFNKMKRNSLLQKAKTLFPVHILPPLGNRSSL